jgi:SAM-dependent methyltransferase
VPPQLYYQTYGRAHAALSLNLLYPRSERAGLGARRRELLAQARGATFELVGAGAGINLSEYPDRVSEVLLVEQRSHLGRRLRRSAAAAGRSIRLVRLEQGLLPLDSACFDTAVSTLALCLVSDLPATLAEIARVLRPGGRLLFMEHVRADSPGLARWQDRLEPPWRYLAIDCHCNRDLLAAIEDSALEIERVERGELSKLGPLVVPLVAGAAVRPANGR